MISDADTEFLNELRKALDDWPHGNTDVIDAVYAYCKTIPDVLQVGEVQDDTYYPGSPEAEKVASNPFSAFGRW